MKRTPLVRKKPMRRGKTRRNSYARRERDCEYMLKVKELPCAVWTVRVSNVDGFDYYPSELAEATPCEGVVEADHAGTRAMNRKALDNTVIPLCTLHHAQRSARSGPFKTWDRETMRAWLIDAIADTQARMRAEGHAIPDC